LLDEKSRQIIVERISNYWGLKYRQGGRGAGTSDLYVKDPKRGVEFFLNDAFARSGGEQAGYGMIAVEALSQCAKKNNGYSNFIALSTAGTDVWNEFVKICGKKFHHLPHKEGSVGENKRLNMPVVQGIIELAQTSINYNPFEEMLSKLPSETVTAYFHLRNISGIGDKIAAFLLRDIVSMAGLDDKIQSQDQILLQPIDRWVNGISAYIWNNPERAPAWFVASRIVSECKKYGCSPIKFNQGAWKYGSSVVQNTNDIAKAMNRSFLK
jgi:hypothetical protein